MTIVMIVEAVLIVGFGTSRGIMPSGETAIIWAVTTLWTAWQISHVGRSILLSSVQLVAAALILRISIMLISWLLTLVVYWIGKLLLAFPLVALAIVILSFFKTV